MNVTTTTLTPTIRNLRMAIMSKGAKWLDIRDLDHNDLNDLNETLKVEYVTNVQEVIVKKLLSIQERSAYHKVCAIKGAEDLIRGFDCTFALESITDDQEVTLLEILEDMVTKKVQKLQERENRLEMRATNRSLYLPQVTLIYEETKDGGRRRWRFETDLISTGILPRMLEAEGHKVEGEPLSLRIVNKLPLVKDENGRLTNQQEPIPTEEYSVLREHGWLPSQENLAWNWGNEALRTTLLNTFPKVIHFGAYNHRLNSPLIPGGFLEKIEVKFSNPMAIDAQPQNTAEVTVAALAEMAGETPRFFRDQGCDGAGLYNPTHPLMSELVSRYGKVCFQITLLRADGLFAKGIVVPREDMKDDESIVLDMAQVKGAWKDRVQEGQVEQGCYVGIMKSWDRISYFPGSFELLEFIRPNKDSAEVQDALNSLVNEAIDNIAKDGVDGLLAEIAKDDEHLKLIVKIIAQIRAHGTNLNPMSVSMVRAAIEDKLKAKLWVIAQGAGIKGRQYVTVLDNTVPEGTCVLSGFKPGHDVAIWRFPCVLPQGLVTCRVSPPSPHHMVGGKPIAHTIFLNPRDLFARMQGDDDGDIVGVSNDPRVLTLFKHRASERVYLIEPKGAKFDTVTDCEAGYKYLETDPRGPVGLTTIWQAQLLACGDWWGAIAMGVLNQEAIDAAKNKIEWTDVAKASIHTMWEENSEGNMVLSQKAKLAEDLCGVDPLLPQGWPGDYTRGWVKSRLQRYGCIQDKKIKMNPLAWRVQEEEVDGQWLKLKKRVNPSYMQLCFEKAGGFTGGNLVHKCHDMMCCAWQKHKSVWDSMFAEADIAKDVRDLLFTLLEQKGRKTELVKHNWKDYMELRERSGIEDFGSKFKKILQGEESDARFGAIEALTQEFHFTLKGLSAAELATIWYWELTPTWVTRAKGQEPTFSHDKPDDGKSWKKNKENHAFRAISFPGSPILPLLGIETEEGCSWLVQEERGQKLTQWAMARKNPFQKLAEFSFKNVSHGDTVKSEGNRCEFQQCRHCMEYLTTSVIRSWRASKTQGEKEYMCELIPKLNKSTTSASGFFDYDGDMQ